jgi:hypothetical protein
MYVTVFIISFLFAAFFAAWRDEYHARVGAENKLEQIEDDQKPRLSGRNLNYIAAPTGEKQQDCLLTLNYEINNGGAPTGLDNFALSITKNGKSYQARILPAENVTLEFASNKARLYFNGEDNVLIRTGREAILKNIPVITWIQAIVYGMTPREFLEEGTSISFSFDDAATSMNHSIDVITIGGVSEPFNMGKIAGETHGTPKPQVVPDAP